MKEIDKYIVFKKEDYAGRLEQLSVPLDSYSKAEEYIKSWNKDTQKRLIILATVKDRNENE